MQRIVIEFDEATGDIQVQHPSNMVLVLGLVEYFRELMMVQKIRPMMAQRVTPVEAMPPPEPPLVPSTQ